METWTVNMGICYPMHMHTTEIPILTSFANLLYKQIIFMQELVYVNNQYYDITSIRISLVKSK